MTVDSVGWIGPVNPRVCFSNLKSFLVLSSRT